MKEKQEWINFIVLTGFCWLHDWKIIGPIRSHIVDQETLSSIVAKSTKHNRSSSGIEN